MPGIAAAPEFEQGVFMDPALTRWAVQMYERGEALEFHRNFVTE
jgi:hypothetical protein